MLPPSFSTCKSQFNEEVTNHTAMASETISVQVQYLQWQTLYETEAPFLRLFKPTPGAEDDRATNLAFETKSVNVQDIRGLQTAPTLDSHGFRIVDCATQVTDFSNPVSVNEKYLAECEKLLRTTVEGADEVLCFDWRVSSPSSPYAANIQSWAEHGQVRDSATMQRGTQIIETSSNPTSSVSGGMRDEDVERARAYDPETRAAMLSPALLVHIGEHSILNTLRVDN